MPAFRLDHVFHLDNLQALLYKLTKFSCSKSLSFDFHPVQIKFEKKSGGKVVLPLKDFKG